MTSTQALMMIRCCGSTLPEESPEVRIKLVQNIWTILENIGIIINILMRIVRLYLFLAVVNLNLFDL